MKNILYKTWLLFVILASASSFASAVDSSSETLKSRYDSYVLSRPEGKEVKTTRYVLLAKTKTEGLSDISKQQHKNALAVYENPNDEKVKIQFIDEFPSNFETYISVFDRGDSGELYKNSYIYIDLLGDLANEYPQKVISLLLSLSKNAMYLGTDATGYLHIAMAGCAANHFDVFLKTIKKMPIQEQKNVSAFIADVENFDAYPEFATILRLLKTHKETKLYQMFLNSKKERIKRQDN